MRIVSLAPNITSTIRYLEEGNEIVACTQHESSKNQEEIGGWLSPDYDRIVEQNPDIVFTSDGLQRDIRDELRDMGLDVHHTEPSSFHDLIPLVESVGEKIGGENVEGYTDKLSRRISKVKNDVNCGKRIYCEEWDKPPMVAGNWVPEIVELIGGSYPFCDAGSRSREITEDEFLDENPDVFVSHVCGQGIQKSFRSFRDKWQYSSPVYFVNDSYLNQLSPRTVKGLEALAEIVSDEDYGMDDIYMKKSYSQCFEN